MPKEKIESVHGYPVFNDVEDKHTQRRNRAVVLGNIIEDNLYEDTGLVTETGFMYCAEYWEAVEEEERAVIYEMLRREVQSRGLLEGGLS